MPHIYNEKYSSLLKTHRLTRHDVVEIMWLVGVDISNSRAENWRRGQTLETPKGIKKNPRYVEMSEKEFNKFEEGLSLFLKKVETLPGKTD